MRKSRSRWRPLHSRDPADAAWRREQARVDADIEGLARDRAAEQFADQMLAEGVPVEQRIARLKAYAKVRSPGKTPRPC